MGLTDARIRNLKPRGRRFLVTDGRGLGLEVMPSGALSWRYRYRLNNQLEKVVLGRYPDLSLKAAREIRDEMASMVARGKSPAREKQLARVFLNTEVTVREFGDRYYADQVLTRVKDPRNVRRYLEAEIYPAFGTKLLKAVTSADVERLVYRKRDNGRHAAAAALRNVLKRLFDYASQRGLVTSNPASPIATRFITTSRPRTRALTPQEIRIYLQTLYGSNIRRQFKLGLHLILLTLARKSELLLAKWQDVHLKAGEWHVPTENSKTGKPHIVYLSRQAIDLFTELKALSGDSEFVLPGRSSLKRPFAHNALNKALAGVSFSIPPFTIHDLRRTGSTLLHEKGFSSDVVEKALNHSIGGIRGVYNRAEYSEDRRKMLQFWGDFVEQLANERKVLIANFGNRA
jgi:integrase